MTLLSLRGIAKAFGGRQILRGVDLELPDRQGYASVPRLRACQPAPLAVLVGGSDDAASGFGALLGDPRHADGVMSLRDVLARAAGS